MSRPTNTSNRIAAALILVCACYHLAVFAVLHALVPSVSPVSGIITDYANSPYPGLARSTFAAFGLMWTSVAVGLWRSLPRTRLSLAGVGLMGFAIASLLLVTLVPAMGDPRRAEEVGTLARIGGIGRAALFVSMLVLAFAVRREPESRNAGTWLLAITGASIALLVVTLAVLLDRGYAGIAQRSIFALTYAWATVVARVLVRAAPG